MSKSEVLFNLTTPILYAAGNGNQEEAHTLIMKEPTARNMTERAVLKQQFMTIVEWIQTQANPDTQTVKEDIPDEDMEAEKEEFATAVSQAIYMAPGVDYKPLLGSFRSLMVEAKCCSVEDERPLTSSLWDKLSPEDIDLMIGCYLVNFLLPS